MVESTSRHARLPIVLVGIGIALFGLVLIAFDMARSYRRDLDEAQRMSRNLVVALAAHTGRTIQAVELAVNAIAGDPEVAAALDGEARPALGHSLADRLSALPQLRSLTVIDAHGQRVATAPDYGQTPASFADRDYFTAIQGRGNDERLHVGVPLIGRNSGGWFVSMVRRVGAQDGTFRGAVLAALDPSYFPELYRSIDVGANGNVSLFHTNGTFIARWPQHESYVGKSAATGDLFRKALPRAAEGTMRLRSVINGRDILLSYKTIANLPLVIVAAFEVNDIFADWHRSLAFYGATAFGIVMLTAAAVALMLRVQQRGEALRDAHRIADAALRDMQITAAESRARNDFFSAMSHELRTPLNGILGYCQLLRTGFAGKPPTERFDEYLRNVEISGHHLLATVNDILDLAKITDGQMRLREEDVALGPLLEECAAIARGMSAAEDQTVELTGDGRAIVLRADALRLKQVVLNLLSNAIKANRSGGTVRLRAVLESGGDLMIAVDDEGPGMTAAEIANAIKPWSRPDVAVQRRFARTGLGLSLTKALAELHGGRLDIVSTPGSGTSARVHLPAARIAPADAAVRPVQPAEA